MDMLICGGVVGVLVGALSALWYLPKSGRQLRQQAGEAVEQAGRALQMRVEAAGSSDRVADSIAQGKAAARQRRRDLGLDDGG
jgi:gas vesicle protein